MKSRFYVSREEKEKVFTTELVKCGVEYRKAVKVANTLATEQPDELITTEDMQLVQDACKMWIKQRKRWGFISQILHLTSGKNNDRLPSS